MTWETFKRVFLGKYFPEDVRNMKEMEFLELEQGNMIVVEYAAKFEELVRYFPYYQGRDGESSKCVKFLNGLRLEVKQAVNYQRVCQFLLLVNMCMIWDEDSCDRAAYYRNTGSLKNKKHGFQNWGKPYPTPSKQYGNHPNNQRTTAIGFSGGSGSKPVTFSTQIICYKCGEPDHISSNFVDKDRTCFNCRQKGYIQRHCPYPKKEQNGGGLNDQTGHLKATGRVFTHNGIEASKSKDLNQGKCFISGIPLLVLFDSGATHSFISCLCVEKLKLSMSYLNDDLVVLF